MYFCCHLLKLLFYALCKTILVYEMYYINKYALPFKKA